jgi:Uma2 family endonuclease
MMAEPTTGTRLMTAEELAALPDDGVRRELVRGEVVTMAAAGYLHGRIAAQICRRLGNHAAETGAGEVVTAEAGFVLGRDPDTVRVPDVGFILAARVPCGDPSTMVDMAADIAVEVVSPNDRPREVAAKAVEWLEGGAQAVWVVWPEERRLQVWRSPSETETLGADDTLTCDDLLPGFSLSLADLFTPRFA